MNHWEMQNWRVMFWHKKIDCSVIKKWWTKNKNDIGDNVIGTDDILTQTVNKPNRDIRNNKNIAF